MLRLHLGLDGWILQLLWLFRLIILVLRAELIEIRVLLIGSTIRLAAIIVMVMVIVMAILQIGQSFGLYGRGHRGICGRDYLWLAGEVGLDVALAPVELLHHRANVSAGAVAVVVALLLLCRWEQFSSGSSSSWLAVISVTSFASMLVDCCVCDLSLFFSQLGTFRMLCCNPVRSRVIWVFEKMEDCIRIWFFKLYKT